MNKQKIAKALAEYILDTESEDFEENASDEHIYYDALIYMFGRKYAKKCLEEALKEELIE